MCGNIINSNPNIPLLWSELHDLTQYDSHWINRKCNPSIDISHKMKPQRQTKTEEERQTNTCNFFLYPNASTSVWKHEECYRASAVYTETPPPYTSPWKAKEWMSPCSGSFILVSELLSGNAGGAASITIYAERSNRKCSAPLSLMGTCCKDPPPPSGSSHLRDL